MYGADGSLAQTVDYSVGTRTQFTYDLANRLVSQKEYATTAKNGGTLRSSTDFTYADKTNYLTGVKHYSPLGTQTIGYTYGDINQGQMPDQIYKVSWNGQEKLNYTYDLLGRLTNRNVILSASEESQPQTLSTQYTYVDVGTDKTTTLLKSISTSGYTLNYTYDAVGNITSIYDGSKTISYEYDDLNQLVRVNDEYQDKTYTYEYVNGNLTFEHVYLYTTGELPDTPGYSTQYHYNDPVWSDVLTGISNIRYTADGAATASVYSAEQTSDQTASESLARRMLGDNFACVDLSTNSLLNRIKGNGVSQEKAAAESAAIGITQETTAVAPVIDYTTPIQSDEIGNIVNIDGMEFNWQGRQLESIGIDGIAYFHYEYNVDGQRVKKSLTDPDTGETTVTEYFYNGSILAGQKTGDDVLVFMYDNNGDIFGFTYNGEPYYYIKNAQNDVVFVVDADGYGVVLYQYDAWGNISHCYKAPGSNIASVNPITYRSYYLDPELGFYYLNTRYYAPMLFRFLNADGYTQTGQGMLDKNMFAYCGNNPVNRSDSGGSSWKDVKDWFSNKWNALKSWASSTFGTSGEHVFQETEQEAILPDVLPITYKTGVTAKSVDSRTGQSGKPVTASYSLVINDYMKSTASVKIQINSIALKLTIGVTDISIMGSYTSGDTTTSLGYILNLSELKLGSEYRVTQQWDEDTSTTTYSNMSINGWSLIALYMCYYTGTYSSPETCYGYGQGVPCPA